MDSVLVPSASSVLCVGFRAVWGRREVLASFVLFYFIFFFKPGIFLAPQVKGFS